MSEEESLSSKFVKNPLAPVYGENIPVARLVARRTDGQLPDRYNVGIEFGVVSNGVAIAVDVAHSYAMAADVMDLSPEQASNLAIKEVREMIRFFETGDAFKPAALTADAT